MTIKYCLLFCITGLFTLASWDRLPAQVVLEEEAEGVQYSLLPVLGYSSDLGVFGGGMFQRIDYGNGIRPFLNSTTADFIASTEKTFSTTIDHERLNSFGTDIRSRIRFQGLRRLYGSWFGIGNDTRFSRSAYDEGYYFFEDRLVTLDYQGRKKLAEIHEQGEVDGQFLLTVSYGHPLSRGDDTLFGQENAPQADGGWVNQAGAGIIIDSRDDEFDPARGFRLEANTKFAGKWTGSEYSFNLLFAEARGYLSPVRNLVIAQKLEIQHSSGNVPFWILPVVGNEDGLRGYIQDRFRGESSILHILEVRTWLLELYDGQIRMGGQLFVDTGRVFAGGDRLRDTVTGLKQTYGIGGVISALNPDFIFRGELAFSEDIYRIYFGIGYLF